MVTIRTIENIKLGSKITLYNGVLAILLGFFYLSFSGFILKIDFRQINKLWGFFVRYDNDISLLFTKSYILLGIIMVAIGICMVYLSLCIYRNKEKEPWAILFIIGGIFWLGLFVMDLLNLNPYRITISALGLLSFLIGMIIPIGYYIRRSEEEY